MSKRVSQKSSNAPAAAPAAQASNAPATLAQQTVVPTPSNRLADFAAAIAPQSAAPATDAEAAPTPIKKGPKPKDFAELATALGYEPKDLYDIQVPSAREGAEAYTLGKLKDLAAEHDSFALSKLKADDDTRKQRAEYLRAEQELTDLFSALPPDAIKPEVRAAFQARRDRAIVAERQRVLDAIPEWKDVSVRTQEIESMIEHMKDNGFPENYLSSVLDHRTLRYIRANWLRETQIRKALERVTEVKSATPGKSSKPATDAPAKPRANGMLSGAEQRTQVFGNLIRNAAK